MQENISPFIQIQNQKQLLTKAILMIYLSQSTLQLYQTYKNSAVIHTINISKYNVTAVVVKSNYQKNYAIQKRLD